MRTNSVIRTASILAMTWVALASTGASAITQAQQNTALSALKDYNVITFGNYKTSNHADGRVFVGGNLTATDAVIDMKNPANPKGIAALTVKGNANFGQNGLNVNGANVRVGGTVTGKVNLNGGGALTTGNAASIGTELINLKTSLTALSGHLSGLSNTSSASYSYDGQVLRLVAPLQFNVINIDASVLSNVNDRLEFTNLGGTTIVNVSGASVSFTKNFTNNSASLGSSILWNFYQAETVTLGDFGGSILAVNADLTKNGNGGINGTVVADNIFGQTAEIRLNSFGGSNVPPIPEASTWAMMIIGLGAVGGTLRSRQRGRGLLQAA